jgi:hypothetical protein
MLFRTCVSLLVLAALSLSSCMVTNLDRNWGSSYQSALVNQQLDPEASVNLDPVYGMDGPAAAGNVSAYRKRFSAEENKAPPGASGGTTALGILGMPGQK